MFMDSLQHDATVRTNGLEEVLRLEKEIEVQETQIQNIETFIHKASQYVGIEELTSYALHELIKAVYVDAPAFVRLRFIYIKSQ